MLLTEEQAKQNWCPWAWVATYDQNQAHFKLGDTVGMCAANKTSDGVIRSGAYCIASECMAWRWEAPNIARGYCGRVGKPE